MPCLDTHAVMRPQVNMTHDDTSVKHQQAGVLLYYGYRDLTCDGAQKAVAEWYESTCTELGLVGRVRVARDGVNATLGGDMDKLKEHMEGIRVGICCGWCVAGDMKMLYLCRSRLGSYKMASLMSRSSKSA